MEVLQTSALPLGDGAGRNWGSKLTGDFRPRLWTRPTATSGRSMVAQIESSCSQCPRSGERRSTHRPRFPITGARSGAAFAKATAPKTGVEAPMYVSAGNGHRSRHPITSPRSGVADAAATERSAQERPQAAIQTVGRDFQAQVRGVERASKRPRNEAHQEGPQAPTFQYWSGKRDSNPRLRPWQGRTLPLSYSRSPNCAGAPQPTPCRCPEALIVPQRQRGNQGRQRLEEAVETSRP
jgi:hypothetical protein